MKNIPEHEMAQHLFLMQYRLLARQGRIEEAHKLADEHFKNKKSS